MALKLVFLRSQSCLARPFLDCSVFTMKNLKFTRDLSSLPNPLKPCKNQGKHPNDEEKSLLKIYQGNPKNQGKEGRGGLN